MERRHAETMKTIRGTVIVARDHSARIYTDVRSTDGAVHHLSCPGDDRTWGIVQPGALVVAECEDADRAVVFPDGAWRTWVAVHVWPAEGE